MKKVEELKPGDVLFDMHNGNFDLSNRLPINEHHKQISAVQFFAVGGSQFIQDAVRTNSPRRLGPVDYVYTNKLLVIVDWPDYDPNQTGVVIVKAAWSYDNQVFGVKTFEVYV